ncbi:Uncharacterised protein [Mycobacteroides abscessus subsp. abscessus]|nr:Uncharacterised protein [Mycobacteroides abscessus subsp. abscessus]
MVSGVVAALALVGCSPAVQGGDTKCKDFVGADEKTQNQAVNKMIKDRKSAEPSSLEVTGQRVSALAWCQTVAGQDAPIKDAPHL